MSANVGVLCASLAFVIYGVYPIYFKQLEDVSPLQMTCHRVVWTFVFVLPLFVWRVEWKSFRQTAIKPKVLGQYVVAAAAVVGMWFAFFWGVSNDFIVETSLGFFMNPILSVLLAVIVLKERLRSWQWVSIALAAAGVLEIAIAYGRFPWLAITIGVLLAVYGFVISTALLNPIESVTVEMIIVVVPALCVLIVSEAQGTGAFGHVSGSQNALMVLSGPVALIPLLLFAHAAHLISFSLLGLLQYIDPILTFIIGVAIYHESFERSKMIGFILVWCGLLIYVVESFVMQRLTSPAVPNDREVASKVEGIQGSPSSSCGGFQAVDDVAVTVAER
ncbi:unnamed protein product [Aphanomyces euteiches]|uniref:EamA domain-containing protein n=1 Tax=Aphanomyces euteiches TaxID=100861 RepID=A0A6G0WSI5_9STRA|nr:hypothetical protein Ae201684_012098 [Aphanomyces euteiches]KAH9056172.1 hypothetical protein Ae201684P_021909 [Aphanomyces euteiches]KAH9141965.1 hypothetical protein AeRB84_013912 [Aphanomyces euteiches]